MASIKINTIFGEIECRAFVDTDPDFEGIEIIEDDNLLGSMIGENLPDEDDEDEMKSFVNKVEIWITEND